MSPIKNFAASILAAARMSDGHSTLPPDEPHREPSIGLTPSLIDSAAEDGEALALPNGDRLAYLTDVVELQRSELTRLLQENRRLNERVDQMVKLQEREQVLRQQMNATLERLSSSREAPALPPSPSTYVESAAAERKYVELKQSVANLVTHIQRVNPEPGAK